MLPVLLFVAVATQPAPAPPPEATAAPLVVPGASSLTAPVPVSFSVPTNAGTIAGTVLLTRLDTRGLDGRGKLLVRGVVDPASVKTDDPVLTAHLKRHVLRADRGVIKFGSGARVRPDPDDPRPGFGVFFDQVRRGKYLELRTRFERGPTGAVLVIDQSVPASGLGLGAGVHPFVEVTGPVALKARIPLR